MQPYTDSAIYYDLIYHNKDYEGECHTLRKRIAQHMVRSAVTLLDVACGTGQHIAHLQKAFHCTGLDLSPGLIAVARQRLPDVPLHVGDMCAFDLGTTFDVVTCLFSAIGYLKTTERLNEAIVTMARHVAAGGLLLVEPWLTREVYRVNHVSGELVEKPGIHLARLSVSKLEDDLSVIDVHHLVATAQGVTHFSEYHELAMFTQADFATAFGSAGLHLIHDPDGLTGRGLYIGVKPEA